MSFREKKKDFDKKGETFSNSRSINFKSRSELCRSRTRTTRLLPTSSTTGCRRDKLFKEMMAAFNWLNSKNNNLRVSFETEVSVLPIYLQVESKS